MLNRIIQYFIGRRQHKNLLTKLDDLLKAKKARFKLKGFEGADLNYRLAWATRNFLGDHEASNSLQSVMRDMYEEQRFNKASLTMVMTATAQALVDQPLARPIERNRILDILATLYVHMEENVTESLAGQEPSRQ